jgi:hypothetical protein
MSKTQDKRAERVQEAENFVKERRANQLAIFEANLLAGQQLFENNKEKLSAEEILVIEKELADNQALLEKLRQEWNL